MDLVAPSSVAIDLAPLQVGSMLQIPRGSRMGVPGLPDLPIEGTAWVTEAAPHVLRMYEVARLAGGIPATFSMALEVTGAREVTWTVRTRVAGVPLPPLSRHYDVLAAGRGWLELRGAGRPDEPVSVMRMTSAGLEVRMRGPFGLLDDRTEPVIQPGKPGYLDPPAQGRY